LTTAPGLPTAGGSTASDGRHAPPALDAHQVSKRFPGVQALTDVSLVIEPGTVHALVGENGAGKSTLVKIIAGLQAPDSGTIEVDGTRMGRFSPLAARELGVALVAQEPEHFADLTALENLFVGRWPREAGLISWPEMDRQARVMLEQMGAEIDLSARMGDLALAFRQVIQIARALLQNAKVLILDEPTAALGQEETRALFDMVRRLSGQGVAIIYISHRLEEIFEIAHQVTVLRDGRHVITCPTGHVSRDDLVRHMVGTEVAEEYAHTPADEGPGADVAPVLVLDRVSSPAGFTEVSLDVRPGEVLALAGLAGSGRNELAHALGGALPIASGRVVVEGKAHRLKGPDGARRLGLVLAPGDRPGRALVLPMTVRENITLSLLRELHRGPLTDVRAEAALAADYIERLDIRTPSAEQATYALSGGNQQKTSLARRLAMRPKVLILEEPTQGVDVGARAEIHTLLRGLAADGLAVVLVSSDLNEVLALSHRVAVMHRGHVAGALPRREATKEAVLDLAFGRGVEASGRAEARPVRRSGRGRELGLAAFLALLVGFLALRSDQFLTVQNIQDMARNSAYLLVGALGMTMVILTAGIDISFGSMLAVCAIISGVLATHGAPVPLVVVATLAVGALCGAVNATGVAFMRLPPIIMTLATLTIYRGLVVRATGGSWITGLPADYLWLGQGYVAGIPVPAVVAAIATAGVALLLRRTAFGRSLYALGNNPSAAEHQGVSRRGTEWLVYVVAGAMVGLSALTFAPCFTSVQTNTGLGFEMIVITGVVVGGTNIMGGRGTILGTVLGVMLLAAISNGLDLLGSTEMDYWESAFQGALVLLAVMTDYIRGRRRRQGAGIE